MIRDLTLVFLAGMSLVLATDLGRIATALEVIASPPSVSTPQGTRS